MASSIIFGIFIILLETHITSGTCTEHSFDVDTANVSLTFKFGWNSTETKRVHCLHGSDKIGDCYYIFEFECSLEATSPGVYTMSTNADLTVVSVTILKFNSTTSGNYSCSYGTTTITKCVNIAVSTSSTTTPGAKTGSPEVCHIGIAAFLVITLVLGVIDAWIVSDGRNELSCNDCCTKQRCRLEVLLILGTVLGVLGVFFAVIGIVILVIAEIKTQCEEGLSIPNKFAMAMGIIGDVLLLIGLIVAIARKYFKCTTYSHSNDDPAKPEVPTELKVRKTGQTELVLEWIPGLNSEENESFTIRCKELDEGNWNVICIQSQVNNYTMHGLKPGKTYQIQMMAGNTVGQSEWTNVITETTLEIGEEDKAHELLAAAKRCSSSNQDISDSQRTIVRVSSKSVLLKIDPSYDIRT